MAFKTKKPKILYVIEYSDGSKRYTYDKDNHYNLKTRFLNFPLDVSDVKEYSNPSKLQKIRAYLDKPLLK